MSFPLLRSLRLVNVSIDLIWYSLSVMNLFQGPFIRAMIHFDFALMKMNKFATVFALGRLQEVSLRWFLMKIWTHYVLVNALTFYHLSISLVWSPLCNWQNDSWSKDSSYRFVLTTLLGYFCQSTLLFDMTRYILRVCEICKTYIFAEQEFSFTSATPHPLYKSSSQCHLLSCTSSHLFWYSNLLMPKVNLQPVVESTTKAEWGSVGWDLKPWSLIVPECLCQGK